MTDRFLWRAGDVLLQRRAAVDRLLESPGDCPSDHPGRDENQDGDEDLGTPIHRLRLPVGALVDLVHSRVLPVWLARVNPRRRRIVAALFAARSNIPAAPLRALRIRG